MRPPPEIRPESQETSSSLRGATRIAPLVIGDPVTGAVLAVLLDPDPAPQSQPRDNPSEDVFFSRLALAAAAALLAFISLVPLERQHGLENAAPQEIVR